MLLKPLKSIFGRKDVPQSGAAAPAAPAAAVPAAAADAACEDVSLQHLWSNEPDALKFQVSRALLPFGEKREYTSAEQAEDAPLARAIFEAGGIAAVTLESLAITVRMQADADWEPIMERLPGMIRKFFAAGGTAVIASGDGDAAQGSPAIGDSAGQRRYRFGFKQVQGRPREEQMQIVQKLFDEEVNPAVAAHGGYFNLLDVQDNKVFVELGGGCQGCGMANVTLRQGVEARLREVLPEMVALIDQTDHASGQNPYYQQSKK